MDREHGRGYSPRQVHAEGIYEARVQFERPNEFQRIEDEVNRFFQRAGSRDPIINQIHEPSKYAEETKMLEFDDPYARIARSRGIIPSSYDRHLQKLIHHEEVYKLEVGMGVVIVSLVASLVVGRKVHRVGKEHESGLLEVEATHLLMDSYLYIVALIALVLSRLRRTLQERLRG